MKPCPFCGGRCIDFRTQSFGGGKWSIAVTCTLCGANGPTLDLINTSQDNMRASALGAWDVRQ
jgi:Lar family restriction alleviation protein